MGNNIDSSSMAETEGVRVLVTSMYRPEQSVPRHQRYVFVYKIRIENRSSVAVHLRTRHWFITDGLNRCEEVQGIGVVGEEPVIQPGDVFEYTSGCILTTPRGEMRGFYGMYRSDGSKFDATIAPFLLMLPHSLN